MEFDLADGLVEAPALLGAVADRVDRADEERREDVDGGAVPEEDVAVRGGRAGPAGGRELVEEEAEQRG